MAIPKVLPAQSSFPKIEKKTFDTSVYRVKFRMYLETRTLMDRKKVS